MMKKLLGEVRIGDPVFLFDEDSEHVIIKILRLRTMLGEFTLGDSNTSTISIINVGPDYQDLFSRFEITGKYQVYSSASDLIDVLILRIDYFYKNLEYLDITRIWNLYKQLRSLEVYEDI